MASATTSKIQQIRGSLKLFQLRAKQQPQQLAAAAAASSRQLSTSRPTQNDQYIIKSQCKPIEIKREHFSDFLWKESTEKHGDKIAFVSFCLFCFLHIMMSCNSCLYFFKPRSMPPPAPPLRSTTPCPWPTSSRPPSTRRSEPKSTTSLPSLCPTTLSTS